MPIVPERHESMGQRALRRHMNRLLDEENLGSLQQAGFETPIGPLRPIVEVTHIRVARDRVIVEVQITNPQCAFTTKHLVDLVEQNYPYLRRHACVNDVGSDFGAVANHTSLLHLLEHMVIEGQVRASRLRDAGRVFVGKSYWTDRACLVGRVEVNYLSDLVALGAIKDAVDFLNGLFVQE
ncbi:MAG: hypothetical protein PUD02_02800 [Eggerthellales bacterium]|nr:hypothetical protein [Eggerthellales bacterium]